MKLYIFFILAGIVILSLLGGTVYFFTHTQIVDTMASKTSQPLPKTPATDSINTTTTQTNSVPLTLLSTTTRMITANRVTLFTTKGDITLELFPDDAPKAVENFLSLVQKKFYDGVIFHRVISGFMIQGGDPTGTGSGGPGHQFSDELNPNTESYKRGYVRGTLAMANAGPNTNGSQFFIMHVDNPLPHLYTIFGRVVSGMDVVDAIAASRVNGAKRPLEDISMTTARIAE